MKQYRYTVLSLLVVLLLSLVYLLVHLENLTDLRDSFSTIIHDKDEIEDVMNNVITHTETSFENINNNIAFINQDILAE